MQYLAECNYFDPKQLLTFMMLVMFVCVVVARTELKNALELQLLQDMHTFGIFSMMFVATCFCYGALASLVPLNCYRIFGPSTH